MFNTKQRSLISKRPTPPTDGGTQTLTANAFVKNSRKKGATTTKLGNNALKFTTTGNDFVDQFGKASNYKAPRSYDDVARDMSILWSQHPLNAIKFALYLRLITRTVVLPIGGKTSTTQRGQGLRNEGILRMLWVAINHPEVFWLNVPLFVACGSWKDIIQLLSLDIQYNGWNGRMLDWKGFGELILSGLENPNTSELIKKYLPQIKPNSRCNTLEAQADNVIAKYICSLLFGKKESPDNYKKYRKLKSSGTAHQWQQVISQGNLLKLDFNTIHGRALSQLVSGKFLKNNNLEKEYQLWIEKQPVAKYTGYVYELFSPLGANQQTTGRLKPYQIDTMNKQFLQLVKIAKEGMNPNSGLIVVVDSSCSMSSLVPGTNVSAYVMAKVLALFFSYLLKGPFQNHFLEFSYSTVFKTWKGSTPVEKLVNDTSRRTESTNFQSVADHFGKILQSGAPESDFPTGILCVSDGCFNSVGSEKTNVETLRKNLRKYGFSKEYVDNFKVILWDIPNGYYGGKSQTAFEEFADCPNLFYLAGFDGSVVSFLTGSGSSTEKGLPTNAEELFEAAMDQEVLNAVII